MGIVRSIGQLVVVAGLVVVGVFAFQEATKYHGGVEDPEGQTTVVFTVDTKDGFGHDGDAAANVLWQYCAGSVFEWDTMSSPRHVDGSTYVAWIRPSVVEHSRRQLTGCLNDLTVDNVLGHVESVTNASTVSRP